MVNINYNDPPYRKEKIRKKYYLTIIFIMAVLFSNLTYFSSLSDTHSTTDQTMPTYNSWFGHVKETSNPPPEIFSIKNIYNTSKISRVFNYFYNIIPYKSITGQSIDGKIHIESGGDNLIVWDSKEGTFGKRLENITFYANYTEDSSYLNGASCNITFHNNSYTMTNINSSYSLSKAFPINGIYAYSITCEESGHQKLTKENNITIFSSFINNSPEITSWPLVKAYPGIEYDIRMGVIGGKYPYRFFLLKSPSGMTISVDKGEIRWTPNSNPQGQSFNISVRVVDQLHQFSNQNFTLNVTKRGFYFVSTTGSDLIGNGSMENPWKTINYSTNHGNLNDILYVRGGKYTGKIAIKNGNINKWIAYPNEHPMLDLNLSTISFHNSYSYVDGFEIVNASRWAFSEGGQDHLVFRRNHMYDLYDDSTFGNPAFVFFWDGAWSDYDIFQDNVFHNISDRGSGINGDDTANYHAGSVVLFDTRYLLYENNEAYNIDGRCVGDKDNGYKNTFRGNILHNCKDGGIRLENQHGQENIEVSYNIVYSIPQAIVIGWQPQYIINISVFKNTVIDGGIRVRGPVNDTRSHTFLIYDNIIENPNSWPYIIEPGASEDAIVDGKMTINYNFLNTSQPYVAGYGWGDTKKKYKEWQSLGYDIGSLYNQKLSFCNFTNYNFRPKRGSLVCNSSSDGKTMGALPCSLCSVSIPPICSNAQPAGILPFGTTSVNISLNTNDDAICKYSLIPKFPYSSMVNIFYGEQATHSALITNITNGKTYIFYVKCKDVFGNSNKNNYKISFAIAGKHEKPIQANSYSLSSTNGVNSNKNFYWVRTYIVNKEKSQGKYLIELSTKDRLKIKIKNHSHYIGVVGLTNKTAVINISSKPQQAIFKIGMEKKFDVNRDGLYDILVKLNGIKNGRANISVQKLTIQQKVEDTIINKKDRVLQDKLPINDKSIPKKGILAVFIVWIVTVLIIFFVAFWLINLKKGKVKKLLNSYNHSIVDCNR